MLRPPAVAGQFYPADPKELRRLIKSCLPDPENTTKVRAVACMVPHAGYIFSGRVVGAVFSTIEIPKKIIVLGVRHRPLGEALAIMSEGAWQTPLGDVPIDSALALRLKQISPHLHEDETAHSHEHSIEVELPFLQVLAKDFSIVPVAVGTHRLSELRELGGAVAQLVKEAKEPLLIVTSSDMNHYEADALTRKKDALAIQQLLELDADGLAEICDIEDISMCGLGPAYVMLTALKLLGATEAELVKYATSGEVLDNGNGVVGYAGMIFH